MQSLRPFCHLFIQAAAPRSSRSLAKAAATSARHIHPPTPTPPLKSFDRRPLLRTLPSISSFICNVSTTASPPSNPAREPSVTPKTRSEQEPAYELTFTCKPCSHRSTHRVSKQGYHKGTVLIKCPGCKNRHVVSDHLKIFSDTSMTIEDLMRQKGQMVKKGTLGTDGDLEFWDDGSTTDRVDKEA